MADFKGGWIGNDICNDTQNSEDTTSCTTTAHPVEKTTTETEE